MEFKEILFQVDEGIATLTLNRADIRNAITHALLRSAPGVLLDQLVSPFDPSQARSTAMPARSFFFTLECILQKKVGLKVQSEGGESK